jgi:hypothetical protein
MALAVTMVGFGILVILTDRPSGVEPSRNPVGMSELCSGNAHLHVTHYHAQFDLTPSGYFMWASVTVQRAPSGDGKCQLAAPVPSDATLIGGQGFRIHDHGEDLRGDHGAGSCAG